MALFTVCPAFAGNELGLALNTKVMRNGRLIEGQRVGEVADAHLILAAVGVAGIVSLRDPQRRSDGSPSAQKSPVATAAGGNNAAQGKTPAPYGHIVARGDFIGLVKRERTSLKRVLFLA